MNPVGSLRKIEYIKKSLIFFCCGREETKVLIDDLNVLQSLKTSLKKCQN